MSGSNLGRCGTWFVIRSKQRAQSAASRHQDELMADWELARQNAVLKDIDPLE